MRESDVAQARRVDSPELEEQRQRQANRVGVREYDVEPVPGRERGEGQTDPGSDSPTQDSASDSGQSGGRGRVQEQDLGVEDRQG